MRWCDKSVQSRTKFCALCELIPAAAQLLRLTAPSVVTQHTQ